MSDTREERLDHAVELAYRYLNRRERTEGEVRSHLRRRGVDEQLAEQAVQTLVEQGALDDARFARLLTQDKRELEGWGADRIRGTLLRRGVAGELTDEALGHDRGGAELDRALELLARRFPAPPQGRRERDRALGVLLRKGYELELALDALSTHARTAGVIDTH